MNENIIFYFGAILIIVFFTYVIMIRFKDNDINLKEHFWIIILYILIMVLAIIAWRVIELLLISNISHINNYNSLIEKYGNG